MATEPDNIDSWTHNECRVDFRELGADAARVGGASDHKLKETVHCLFQLYHGQRERQQGEDEDEGQADDDIFVDRHDSHLTDDGMSVAQVGQ